MACAKVSRARTMALSILSRCSKNSSFIDPRVIANLDENEISLCRIRIVSSISARKTLRTTSCISLSRYALGTALRIAWCSGDTVRLASRAIKCGCSFIWMMYTDSPTGNVVCSPKNQAGLETRVALKPESQSHPRIVDSRLSAVTSGYLERSARLPQKTMTLTVSRANPIIKYRSVLNRSILPLAIHIFPKLLGVSLEQVILEGSAT
jgi:hypothetical protein